MSQSEQIDELFAALSIAQGKIEGAKKDQKNPHFKSMFAGLSATWDACREALAENGLAVVQTTMPTADGIFLVTTLGHKSGQWIRGETPLFMDRQGMQPLGSAITYARRYGLQGVTGIAPVDDDGEAATDHDGKGKEPVFGKLTKTKLQAKMREFDTDLHAVEDIDSLEGLLASYREDLNQCERDLKSWYYTKRLSDGSMSETLGIQDRILAKRTELEKAQREGPAPEGPQEPTESPQSDDRAARRVEASLHSCVSVENLDAFWDTQADHHKNAQHLRDVYENLRAGLVAKENKSGKPEDAPLLMP